MGIIPDWWREFPRSLKETFQERAKEGWEGFKKDIGTGSKKVGEGVQSVTKIAGKLVGNILGGLTPTLIIIAIILVLVLIFWKKIK